MARSPKRVTTEPWLKTISRPPLAPKRYA
jgi:hypothetical protein